ncbi:MAG TPA: hypothetical protein VL551_07775 [Actinospica sp.]|nr:hypothetical protein [Actinospica sp.]
MPPPGWQALFAEELAEHARSDLHMLEMRVHGSASGNADAVDAWSDLDLLITALDARASEPGMHRFSPPTAATDPSGAHFASC